MSINDGDQVTSVRNPMWLGKVIGTAISLDGTVLYVVEVLDKSSGISFYVASRSALAVIKGEVYNEKIIETPTSAGPPLRTLRVSFKKEDL